MAVAADDVLIIGAGPAGLLAAWTARQRGARVRVLATGIGTTHVSAGWIGVLDAAGDLNAALDDWIAREGMYVFEPPGEVLVVHPAGGRIRRGQDHEDPAKLLPRAHDPGGRHREPAPGSECGSHNGGAHELQVIATGQVR